MAKVIESGRGASGESNRNAKEGADVEIVGI